MQKEFVIGGYQFANAEDAKKAKEELQRVKLLNEKIDVTNLDAIYSVYEKAISNHVFSTPIGIAFLTELRQILVQNAYNKEISPIIVPTICVEYKIGEEGMPEKVMSDPEQQLVLSKLRVRAETLEKQLGDANGKAKKLRLGLRSSKMLNVVLIVLIGILFFITITGENANALNYKRVITDKYASWEEELTRREQALREAEAQKGSNQTEVPQDSEAQPSEE